MNEFPYRIVFKYGPIEIELDGDKEFVKKQFLQIKELLEKILEKIPMEERKKMFEIIKKISDKSEKEE